MTLLTETELAAALGVADKRLKKWIRRGLPAVGKGKDRRFDAAAVAAWLQAKSLVRPAAPTETIATTFEEAARLLRVNVRTIKGWATEPGFPGKAGSPGRRDGHFPIESIETWRDARFGHATATNADAELKTLRQKSLGFDVDLKQLDVEERLGTVLDKEQQAQFLERVIATAKSQLEELPDRHEAALPAKASPRLRRRLRRITAKLVREVLRTIAELTSMRDEDETEETDQEPGASQE